MENELILESAARITPQWVAGFFDGEGTVCASKAGPMYNVSVMFTNTDLRVLTLLALKFQPCVGPDLKKTHFGNKPCYRIKWGGRRAIEFLEYIKDHVIVKRVQVEAGLEIARFVSRRDGRGGDDRSYGQVEADRREELAKVIITANHS